MNLQGCLLKVLPGKEGLMVFEISECAKMKIYKHGHCFTFRQTARTFEVTFSVVTTIYFQALVCFRVKFLWKTRQLYNKVL